MITTQEIIDHGREVTSWATLLYDALVLAQSSDPNEAEAARQTARTALENVEKHLEVLRPLAQEPKETP